MEFVALGHSGSEHYAGLESFPNPGVTEVELRGLRVGDATVDLRFAGGRVEAQGEVEVKVTPPSTRARTSSPSPGPGSGATA